MVFVSSSGQHHQDPWRIDCQLSDDFMSDQNEIPVFRVLTFWAEAKSTEMGFASITFQGRLDPGDFNLAFLP
jgi:hypothetical protein